MTFKDETWKAVVGFEGYEVSDLGRVRSLKYGKVKLLRPRANRKGYLRVELCKNGKRKDFYVHRVVVTVFIGPIPKGMVVNHLNEDKTDNRLSNLEVITPKENCNYGTRNERAGKTLSKQLDLIEADWPYRELTFKNSYIASEFFGYCEGMVKVLISKARRRGENWINLRGTKYIFAQSGC